jgi:alpha-beta hydrolase superfamily lysophospholipase
LGGLVTVEHDYRLEVQDTVLLGTAWSVPNPRAIVAVAHGINEHIGRYERVAKALNTGGFSVVGVDHRGHGRSCGDGPRTSNIRRFDTFVEDYIALIDRLGREQAAPVVALGHSMGGLIVTRAALRAQDRMAAIVLSAPALKLPTPVGPVRLRLMLLAARFFPDLSLPAGDLTGLSRDPEWRTAIEQDPLAIRDPVKYGIARQLYLLSEETRARAPEVRAPLLVMHGDADPITDPAGSREFVERAASRDKGFVSWPENLHEIFNDLDKVAVLKRLTGWLQARFPAPLAVV